MANIKSQIKRNRQNNKKRLRNRVYRSEARIAVRNARISMDEQNPESKKSLVAAISALDKAAEQGVIHPNNAARRKSRLMKQYAKQASTQITLESPKPTPVLESAPVMPAPEKKSPSRKAAVKKTTQAEKAVKTKKEAKKKTTVPAGAEKKSTAKKPAASSPAVKKTDKSKTTRTPKKTNPSK